MTEQPKSNADGNASWAPKETTTVPGELVWVASGDAETGGQFAYSGRMLVGYVTMVIGSAGKWAYALSAVEPNRTTKCRGDVSSRASARRAVERAWRTWLKHAGVIPGS